MTALPAESRVWQANPEESALVGLDYFHYPCFFKTPIFNPYLSLAIFQPLCFNPPISQTQALAIQALSIRALSIQTL